jgi:carboxyl-terminal processing protease
MFAKMRKNFFLFGALVGAGLTVLVTQTGVMSVGLSALAAAPDTYQELSLLGDVFERVRVEYVDKPDDHRLIVSAIDGMLRELDPHSGYVDQAGLDEMQRQNRGEFAGVGLEVTKEDDRLEVVTPIENSPAAKAGIAANDVITKIDNKPVSGMTLDQAVEKLHGPKNTAVRLTISRKGHDRPIDITIVRQVINVKSVQSRAEGNDVGYIRITEFTEQTTDGLRTAIRHLIRKIGAGNIKGFVLDLRNNPGGLVDQAVSVAASFLNNGEIVSIRGRNTEDVERYNARARDLTRGKALIVLINGGSASASEIVAGALQDRKRATLIGTRSFGKGSVQTIIPLAQGEGALRLTTARYFTPSGRSIQAKGIEPDINVPQAVPDYLSGRIFIQSEASLYRHLKAEGDEQSGSQSYVPDDEKDDRALQAALDLLRGVAANAAFPPNSKPDVSGLVSDK